MGVLNLWQILDPVKQHQELSELKGQVLAVDLSIWVCETQCVKQMQGVVSKPFLRNLFFRILHLLQLGVHLVFVVEGEAPDLKKGVMQKRQQDRFRKDFGGQSYRGPRGGGGKGGRRNFDARLRECCRMLDCLGIPYLHSNGEAEAFCAALNAAGLVDGCLTNDGDAFLYGARTVYRNFTMNTKDPHVESYIMDNIESRLGLDRERMVAMALLLGCDYLPKGVPGVGVDKAIKLMTSLQGYSILDRFHKWRRMSDIECVVEALGFCSGLVTRVRIVSSIKIRFIIPETDTISPQTVYTTIETQDLFSKCFPQFVQQHDELMAAKKTKGKSKKKKTVEDGDRINSQDLDDKVKLSQDLDDGVKLSQDLDDGVKPSQDLDDDLSQAVQNLSLTEVMGNHVMKERLNEEKTLGIEQKDTRQKMKCGTNRNTENDLDYKMASLSLKLPKHVETINSTSSANDHTETLDKAEKLKCISQKDKWKVKQKVKVNGASDFNLSDFTSDLSIGIKRDVRDIHRKDKDFSLNKEKLRETVKENDVSNRKTDSDILSHVNMEELSGTDEESSEDEEQGYIPLSQRVQMNLKKSLSKKHSSKDKSFSIRSGLSTQDRTQTSETLTQTSIKLSVKGIKSSKDSKCVKRKESCVEDIQSSVTDTDSKTGKGDNSCIVECSASTGEEGTGVPLKSSVSTGEEGTGVPLKSSVSTGEGGTGVPNKSSVPTGEEGTGVPHKSSLSTVEEVTKIPLEVSDCYITDQQACGVITRDNITSTEHIGTDSVSVKENMTRSSLNPVNVKMKLAADCETKQEQLHSNVHITIEDDSETFPSISQSNNLPDVSNMSPCIRLSNTDVSQVSKRVSLLSPCVSELSSGVSNMSPYVNLSSPHPNVSYVSPCGTDSHSLNTGQNCSLDLFNSNDFSCVEGINFTISTPNLTHCVTKRACGEAVKHVCPHGTRNTPLYRRLGNCRPVLAQETPCQAERSVNFHQSVLDQISITASPHNITDDSLYLTFGKSVLDFGNFQIDSSLLRTMDGGPHTSIDQSQDISGLADLSCTSDNLSKSISCNQRDLMDKSKTDKHCLSLNQKDSFSMSTTDTKSSVLDCLDSDRIRYHQECQARQPLHSAEESTGASDNTEFKDSNLDNTSSPQQDKELSQTSQGCYGSCFKSNTATNKVPCPFQHNRLSHPSQDHHGDYCFQGNTGTDKVSSPHQDNGLPLISPDHHSKGLPGNTDMDGSLGFTYTDNDKKDQCLSASENLEDGETEKEKQSGQSGVDGKLVKLCPDNTDDADSPFYHITQQLVTQIRTEPSCPDQQRKGSLNKKDRRLYIKENFTSSLDSMSSPCPVKQYKKTIDNKENIGLKCVSVSDGENGDLAKTIDLDIDSDPPLLDESLENLTSLSNTVYSPGKVLPATKSFRDKSLISKYGEDSLNSKSSYHIGDKSVPGRTKSVLRNDTQSTNSGSNYTDVTVEVEHSPVALADRLRARLRKASDHSILRDITGRRQQVGTKGRCKSVQNIID
ncbi:LOW QUALITY PROTEIN: uncharacterized protein [Argopecten irradians]|uniref:LOW QUALITY PROTEIN: uncharacterized protein n=1 Tax=Argopecten irradians TaxID=31199 RepID=UPI0037127060